MSSTFSTSLRIELMADGENDGTWGQKTNVNLGTLIESAIAGAASVTMSDADKTLTTLNGADDEARHAVLLLSGVLTASRAVIIPDVSKVYIVKNATTGGFDVTVGTSAGVKAMVKNGATALMYCDGTNSYIVGATVGVDAQAYSALLTAVAALTPTDGNIIVGNGTTWVAENGATARTSLGAAKSGANDDITSLTGLSTAVTVAQGGTGATTAADARTALGAVGKIGNETIDGVKTFSSSPIVPTPTTATQAANKKFVEDSVAVVSTGNLAGIVSATVGFTVDDTYYGKYIQIPSSVVSPLTITLPQAVVGLAGKALYVNNNAAANVTLSSVSNIVGAGVSATSVVIPGGQAQTMLVCDGTQWNFSVYGIQNSGAAPVFGARAWGYFNGTGTLAILGSGNIEDIDDLATGKYRIYFAVDMPHANYAIVGSARGTAGDTSYTFGELIGGSKTTSYVDVQVTYSNDAFVDSSNISFAVFC